MDPKTIVQTTIGDRLIRMWMAYSDPILGVIPFNKKNWIGIFIHTVCSKLTLPEQFCHILWFYSCKETFDCKCGPEHESHPHTIVFWVKSVNMLNVLLICVWISRWIKTSPCDVSVFLSPVLSLSTSLFLPWSLVLSSYFTFEHSFATRQLASHTLYFIIICFFHCCRCSSFLFMLILFLLLFCSHASRQSFSPGFLLLVLCWCWFVYCRL